MTWYETIKLCGMLLDFNKSTTDLVHPHARAINTLEPCQVFVHKVKFNLRDLQKLCNYTPETHTGSEVDGLFGVIAETGSRVYHVKRGDLVVIEPSVYDEADVLTPLSDGLVYPGNLVFPIGTGA